MIYGSEFGHLGQKYLIFARFCKGFSSFWCDIGPASGQPANSIGLWHRAVVFFLSAQTKKDARADKRKCRRRADKRNDLLKVALLRCP